MGRHRKGPYLSVRASRWGLGLEHVSPIVYVPRGAIAGIRVAPRCVDVEVRLAVLGVVWVNLIHVPVGRTVGLDSGICGEGVHCLSFGLVVGTCKDYQSFGQKKTPTFR